MFVSIQTGKYFLRTRNIEQGKVSRLLRSPNFTVEEESCLQFDFFDSAGETVDPTEIKTLSVTLQTFIGTSHWYQLKTHYFLRSDTVILRKLFLKGGNSGELYENRTIWRVFGTMKDAEWHYAHANITTGTHNLIFEVNGDNYRAGIKNITVVPGYCPEYSKLFLLHDLPF